jgi:hypothetical protein
VVRRIPWDFDATVPFTWQPANPNFGLFHAVPTGQMVTMMWRLALSQTPNHDPADQPLPDWADTWMREYDSGTNMTTFFGAKPGDVPTAER